MVCLADDLVGWKDFPKGLRVLLLDKDSASASETKLKLEAMDYVVTLFCNENDALETISRSAESFHVAIVEITNGNSSGGFRFLELVRDLPTIVVSNFRCLNTMMKCLALGAAEFLEKPLSEDKLRNLWQHVVHKAFNAGKSAISNSLKPIKETVASLLRLESETADPENGTPLLAGALDKHQPVSSQEDIETREKFPAPSTPQLEQGIRLTDDGDNKPNCSIDDVKTLLKNSSCSKSKSVDITINNLNDVVSNREAAEDEVDSVDGSRSDECSAFKEGSLPPLNNSDNSDSAAKDPETEKPCDHANSNSHANKTNKKKMKVDWTPELHRKFVQAVEQLGMDQAIPSKILELMKAEGLTRHNVASHLQKYRMHRRHILPKDDDKRWKQQRENTPMRYVQRPLVPVSPYPCHYGYPPSQVYPAWGHPALHHSAPVPVWSHAAFSPWPRPPESWHWRPYSGVHADAWGCPVVRPYGQYSIPTQSTAVDNCLDASGDLNKDVRDFSDVHVADEVIDEVVKEAMSKPWLPLPLGLKPPSTDSVLAELHRQGVSSIPLDLPLHHHHRPQSRSLS